MLVYHAVMFAGTLLQLALAIIAIGAGVLARRWWVASWRGRRGGRGLPIPVAGE